MSRYWGWDGMSEGLVAECSLNERMLRNIGGMRLSEPNSRQRRILTPHFCYLFAFFLIDSAYFGFIILQISRLMFLRTMQSTFPLDVLNST